MNQFQQLLFYTFPHLMNLIFLVLVLMPRFLKADFLQEEMIRIANFFASFIYLCISNQDPAQELCTQKTWIINSQVPSNKYSKNLVPVY